MLLSTDQCRKYFFFWILWPCATFEQRKWKSIRNIKSAIVAKYYIVFENKSYARSKTLHTNASPYIVGLIWIYLKATYLCCIYIILYIQLKIWFISFDFWLWIGKPWPIAYYEIAWEPLTYSIHGLMGDGLHSMKVTHLIIPKI